MNAQKIKSANYLHLKTENYSRHVSDASGKLEEHIKQLLSN